MSKISLKVISFILLITFLTVNYISISTHAALGSNEVTFTFLSGEIKSCSKKVTSDNRMQVTAVVENKSQVSKYTSLIAVAYNAGGKAIETRAVAYYIGAGKTQNFDIYLSRADKVNKVELQLGGKVNGEVKVLTQASYQLSDNRMHVTAVVENGTDLSKYVSLAVIAYGANGKAMDTKVDTRYIENKRSGTFELYLLRADKISRIELQLCGRVKEEIKVVAQGNCQLSDGRMLVTAAVENGTDISKYVSLLATAYDTKGKIVETRVDTRYIESKRAAAFELYFSKADQVSRVDVQLCGKTGNEIKIIAQSSYPLSDNRLYVTAVIENGMDVSQHVNLVAVAYDSNGKAVETRVNTRFVENKRAGHFELYFSRADKVSRLELRIPDKASDEVRVLTQGSYQMSDNRLYVTAAVENGTDVTKQMSLVAVALDADGKALETRVNTRYVENKKVGLYEFYFSQAEKVSRVYLQFSGKINNEIKVVAKGSSLTSHDRLYVTLAVENGTESMSSTKVKVISYSDQNAQLEIRESSYNINSKCSVGVEFYMQKASKIKQYKVYVNGIEQNVSFSYPQEQEDPGAAILVFSGQSKRLSGKLNADSKIKKVRATVKRVGGFEYNTGLYLNTKISTNSFDLSDIQFAALGEHLSVPGNFQITVFAATEKKPDEYVAGQYMIQVLDPVIRKEARYLPESDEVYLMAEIHKEVGQKKENEWPVVWVGVYDTVEQKWLYVKPDVNNIMKHVGFNTYEMYFPAWKLHRNEKLKFIFLVDGYNEPNAIKLGTERELVVNPLPKANWSVLYNVVTNKFEAFADPDIANKSIQVPDIFVNVYDENGKALYEGVDVNTRISVCNDPNSRYYRKYYREWTPEELWLERGKSFKFGIRAKGFEDQLGMSLFSTINLSRPVVAKWNVKYDPVSKKIKAWVQTSGTPAKYKVRLCESTLGKSYDFSMSYGWPYNINAQASLSVDQPGSGFELGKNYNFYIKILDENNREVDKTGLWNLKLPKPEPPPVVNNMPAVNPYQGYIDFANAHKLFDAKEQFSFRESDWYTAARGKVTLSGALIELPNAIDESVKTKLVTTYKWLKGDNISEKEKDWVYNYTKSECKSEIRNMLEPLNEVSAVNKAADIFKELKGKADKYLALNLTVAKDEHGEDIKLTDTKLMEILTETLGMSRAKDYVDKLRKNDKISYSIKALDYVLLLASVDEIRTREVYAFKTVSDHIRKVSKSEYDLWYCDAIDELVKEYERERSAKFDAFANQLASDMANWTSGKVIDLLSKRANLVLAVVDVVFAIAFEQQRTSLNSTLIDSRIMFFAQNAYQNFVNQSKKDGKSIRAAGLVHLLAAAEANKNYAKFLGILANRWYTSESDMNDWLQNKAKCEEIEIHIRSAVNTWMEEALLPESFFTGGGGGGGGSGGGF